MVDQFVDSFAKQFGALAAGDVYVLITEIGKTYLLPPLVGDTQASSSQVRGRRAAFSVIGLGRCGTRVTTSLGEMVAGALSQVNQGNITDAAANPLVSYYREFQRRFGRRSDFFPLEPVMCVGDLEDETVTEITRTFEMAGSQYHKMLAERLLKIDFSALAVGGAGHQPLAAEFLSSALLALPPDKSWSDTQAFLLSNIRPASDGIPQETPRLVFYVFSAGGGTGAGCAARIMAAQRISLERRGGARNPTYFSGVAIIPDDIDRNETYAQNSGRTILRYLGSLDIAVTGPQSYRQPPQCLGEKLRFAEKASEVDARYLLPWNGLLLISNAAMLDSTNTVQKREEIEQACNKYIARQMFSLAASQLPIDIEDNDRAAAARIDSIRLDPSDLQNTLIGPFFSCFSSTEASEFANPNDLDRLFVRALGVPGWFTSTSNSNPASKYKIEGVSLLPCTGEMLAKYNSDVEALIRSLSQKDSKVVLNESHFEIFQSSPMFTFGMHAVAVMTCPADFSFPGFVEPRLKDLLEMLLRRMHFPRVSLVKGATEDVSLSIFVDGSPILAPEPFKCIEDYLKLCWSRRSEKAAVFRERLEEFRDRETITELDDVVEWLGNREDPISLFPNYESKKSEIHAAFGNYLRSKRHRSDELPPANPLRLEDLLVDAKEVRAALQFLSYVSRRRVASRNPLAQPSIPTPPNDD